MGQRSAVSVVGQQRFVLNLSLFRRVFLGEGDPLSLSLSPLDALRTAGGRVASTASNTRRTNSLVQQVRELARCRCAGARRGVRARGRRRAHVHGAQKVLTESARALLSPLSSLAYLP